MICDAKSSSSGFCCSVYRNENPPEIPPRDAPPDKSNEGTLISSKSTQASSESTEISPLANPNALAIKPTLESTDTSPSPPRLKLPEGS